MTSGEASVDAGALPAPSETQLGAKPVFIIGMPRSGSTWLMWLLARHPEVVIVQQSALFMPLQRLDDWWKEDHRFTMNGKDAPAPAKPRDLRDPKEVGYGNGAYAMHRSTSVLAADDLYRHCRSLCRQFVDTLVRGTPGARYLVDQTPEHIEFTPLIRAILPEAHFLHVLRDPRASINSIKKAISSWADPGGLPSNTVQIASGWRRYGEIARGLRDETDQYHCVRYEDLRADGDGELRKMHEWLGLPTDPDSRSAALEASELGKLRKNTHMPPGFFRKGSAQGWREELSKSDLRVIEYLAGEEMERWGYERVLPPSQKKPLRVKAYEAAERFFEKPRGRRNLRGIKRLLRTVELMQSSRLVKY